MKNRKITFASLVAVLIILSACDSERLGQFSAFATAGSLYVTNLHPVIQEAGSAMIAADSTTLIAERNLANGTSGSVEKDPDHFKSRVIEDDQLIEKYLANLQLVDEHATVLGSYFHAIAQLTDGKAASGTASAATDLLDSISKLNVKMGDIKFKGPTVSDTAKSLASAATSVIVAHFEVKALDEQLTKAQPVIQQALTLQEAALHLIGEQLKEDLRATLTAEETTEVVDPYLQKQGVPPNWNSSREKFLRAKVNIDRVNSAETAAKKLNITFKQLVENKNASPDMTSLLSDISKMSGYASSLESVAKGK